MGVSGKSFTLRWLAADLTHFSGSCGRGISRLKDTFIQLRHCMWRSCEPALHFPKLFLLCFLLLSASLSKPFSPPFYLTKTDITVLNPTQSPGWRVAALAKPPNWQDPEEWYSCLVIVGNTTRCCSVKYWLFFMSCHLVSLSCHLSVTYGM